jgi:predicted dehydrogenase
MKILIVGLGAVGQRHGRNLRQLLGKEVELCAFRQRGLGVSLTDRLEIEPTARPEDTLGLTVFRNLDKALASGPDAVIVANPSSFHLGVARQAAEAACALFIEKPVSHTWDGVPELARLVAEKKLTTMVGCQWRFHPILARARAILDGKSLGRLVAVNAVYGEHMPSWHPYEDYRLSYASRREMGGGVLLTQIHEFDYLGWVVGWPEQVFSMGGHLSDLEIDVEDTASTLLKCRADGRPIPVHVHQDYLQKPPVRTCDFIAEKGRLHVNLLEARLKAWDAEGRLCADEDFSTLARNEMFLSEMRHFLECVEGKTESCIPFAEGVKSLAVAVAAQKSLQSGSPENVVYLQP